MDTYEKLAILAEAPNMMFPVLQVGSRSEIKAVLVIPRLSESAFLVSRRQMCFSLKNFTYQLLYLQL
jgi:hypothetical protein